VCTGQQFFPCALYCAVEEARADIILSLLYVCPRACLRTRKDYTQFEHFQIALALVQTLEQQRAASAAEVSAGNCPTCIGPVDGTLGSCAGLDSCLSSFDDRPAHFVNPWEFEDDPVRAPFAFVLLSGAVGC
jgi:hypothetical protein